MFRYHDGRVTGIVDMGDNWAVIYEWSSSISGRGHTKDALKWLRSQGAQTIAAYNMGKHPEPSSVIEPHTRYWLKMREMNLVDHLLDDDGNIYVSPAPSSPLNDEAQVLGR
jgi:hypothetical protein